MRNLHFDAGQLLFNDQRYSTHPTCLLESDVRTPLPTSPALLELGFRPFFLAGAVFAALVIPLWVAGWLGHVGHWQPVGGWYAWHTHEMLFGFATAIIAGFLLTAVANWTGCAGLSGGRLGSLVLLWLLARIAWLASLPTGIVVALDSLFLPVLALYLARPLWHARQQRNYPVVLILALLALCNVVSLSGLATSNPTLQRQGNVGALWLIAVLMGLIAGRVIPAFTQRGLDLQQPLPIRIWLDYSLLVGGIIAALAMLSGIGLQADYRLGILFGLLGAGHILRLLLWQGGGVWPRLPGAPLLWSLHLAYAWLGMACIGMALWNAGVPISFSQAVHMLAIGSMSGLILAMIARVSLGHTGRPLRPAAAMSVAFVLINLAALLRIWLAPTWPQAGFWLAALGWSGAFGLFIWCYAAILCRPRRE